jgi:hypothetical protein
VPSAVRPQAPRVQSAISRTPHTRPQVPNRTHTHTPLSTPLVHPVPVIYNTLHLCLATFSRSSRASHRGPNSHPPPPCPSPPRTSRRINRSAGAVVMTGRQLFCARNPGFNRFPFNNFTLYLTPFSRCFSSFPHGTCSLSVSCPYLALDEVYHPFELHSQTTRLFEPAPRPASRPCPNGILTLCDGPFQDTCAPPGSSRRTPHAL